MPNVHTTLTSLFSAIANAIRGKTGSSAQIVADDFPNAIDAIPTGTPLPPLTDPATAADVLNGKEVILPDANDEPVKVTGTREPTEYTKELMTSVGDITTKEVLDAVPTYLKWKCSTVRVWATGDTPISSGSYSWNNHYMAHGNISYAGKEVYSAPTNPPNATVQMSPNQQCTRFSIASDGRVTFANYSGGLGGAGTKVYFTEWASTSFTPAIATNSLFYNTYKLWGET